MALSSEEFYQQQSPDYLQQGDVLSGVPLLLLPADSELVLVRSYYGRKWVPQLQPGTAELVRESATTDAFRHGSEYVVVSAVRSMAVLMTATCDLVDTEQWLVCPLHRVKNSGYDEGNLRAGKYATLYLLAENDRFPSAFIDLSDLRPIRSKSIDLNNRVASITRDGQNDLVERFVKAMGRNWGHAPGDTVEPPGKYQTGRFRCARCNQYDVPITESTFEVGSKFPVCTACEKINKAAQWYPLSKHRKS